MFYIRVTRNWCQLTALNIYIYVIGSRHSGRNVCILLALNRSAIGCPVCSPHYVFESMNGTPGRLTGRRCVCELYRGSNCLVTHQ